MAETWRDRLARSIEATGRSHRDISLAAGAGSGYVNSLINDGKEPGIDKLLKVCEAAKVSIYYVLGGFDITPDKEELLRLLSQVDPEVQQSVLTLLRQRQPDEAGSRRRA